MAGAASGLRVLVLVDGWSLKRGIDLVSRKATARQDIKEGRETVGVTLSCVIQVMTW